MARAASKPLSKDYFVSVGRKWGSSAVAREAEGAIVRWRRDAPILADYGHGPSQLEEFVLLVKQHQAMVSAQPDAVAGRRNIVARKDFAFKAARVWLDKAVCILKRAAQLDEKLAIQLQEALPDDDMDVGEQPHRILALKKLLADARPIAPRDANVDARIIEADALAEELRSAPGTVGIAKSATVRQTAELDLLDGRIYVAIRELNEAACKAIRNGMLKARLSEYKFAHLRKPRR